MIFNFCILLVFFFTVSEAQEEQPYIAVIDSTDLREENPFVSQEAKDALFKWSLKQSSGVYKKLIKSEKSSTVGKDTSIRVWLQDTDCPILEKKFSSYADIEAKCNGMGQSKDCTIQFKNPEMKKVSLTCIIRKDVRPEEQPYIAVIDSTDLREENPFVSQEAKDALFKWSLKQSSGVYKKLIKSEKSSTVGKDTSIRVWLQDTDCPILEKKFSSYADIEAKCNGMGQSKDCTIQFKNPEMKKVSLTCIIRKDVRPTQQSDILVDNSADWKKEYPSVAQQAKDALLKWSLKQSSGVYKKLIKSEKSSTVGTDTSIRVWLQDTDCPILAKKFSSYNDIEAQCNGMGQSEDCTIQFKNPDMAKVTLTCIVRKDVKPIVLQSSQNLNGTSAYVLQCDSYQIFMTVRNDRLSTQKMIDSSQLPRKHMCDANPSQNALNELKYESFQGVMCRNH
ncbi:hypothetical protein T05_11425 [Trichinella murrelli]|uniref:Secreted protein n=1 Tax=Trichinella murrelli TaxID=144512 RepID=A0A0V0T9N9_9BILA|nr:hypothetical protein T05_11425 [Trichinella murrelli]